MNDEQRAALVEELAWEMVDEVEDYDGLSVSCKELRKGAIAIMPIIDRIAKDAFERGLNEAERIRHDVPSWKENADD